MKKLTVLIIVVALAGAMATVLTGGSEAQRELGPQHVHVNSERLWVEDPAGGPRWLALAYRKGDRYCLRYGSRAGGQWLRGRGDRGCYDRDEAPLSASIGMTSPPGQPTTTVVRGVSGRGVERVTVATPTGSTTFTFARVGLPYLTVHEGWLDHRAITVTLTFTDGRRQRLFGPMPHEVLAPDPDGGAPWSVSSSRFRFGARGGQTCVQFHRLQPRYARPVGETPGKVVCGDLTEDPFFVTTVPWDENTRERRPGEPLESGSPTQTILYGAVAPQVDEVRLTNPRGTERLPLSRRRPAFIAVFDAKGVQRDDLAVEFVFQDGRTERVRAPLNVNRAGVLPESERRDPPARSRRRARARGTCRTSGARTLLKTPRGIVQAREAGGVVRYYACRYSGQAKSVIHTDAAGAPFLHPTLTSSFVAFAHGGGISVKDIRSGETVRASRRDPSPDSVKALVLTERGHLAWITVGEDGAAVHVSDSRGERIAARGSIEPASLRRQGSRVFWVNAGDEQTEFLR